jgi:hypothetical protein
VVGLYIDPPAKAIVLCVDEKPSIQALERAQGYLKLPNGRALTGQSHDYKRHGTTTLFAALEVTTGKIIAEHSKRRRRIEFLGFMNRVVSVFPDREMHVIVDNLNTHKKCDRWLKKHPLPFHPDAVLVAQSDRDLVFTRAPGIARRRRFIQKRQNALVRRLTVDRLFRRARAIVQAGKPVVGKAVPPFTHDARPNADFFCDRTRAAAISCQQHYPRPFHLALRRAGCPAARLKHLAYLRREPNFSCFGNHPDLES